MHPRAVALAVRNAANGGNYASRDCQRNSASKDSTVRYGFS